MSKQLIKGLHHVTAMASSPQQNVDFYVGVLGLRLVKKTVNFDAPDVYHLYYGDETGNPGSILTFFPFRNIRPGAHGLGQAATTTFSIPKSAIDYWLKRFEHLQVSHKPPQERFDEVVIYFEDWDGLGLELIANDRDQRAPFTYGHIPLEHSIRGFYSVELWESTYERTESLLVKLDHQFVRESGPRRRYSTHEKGEPGKIIDIVWDAQKQYGMDGSGTVHHIAFDTPSDADQLAVREKLLTSGVRTTQVLDRQYFHSIYFREPGGVLFEVATTPPGFLYDEDKANLGESLKLPPWEEHRREYIENLLQPITLNPEKYASPS
ncbi:VOC family protein [Flavilitoribacter nigricans]|uniref:Ring-cleaving dioxygenase n=1 Tax=Flavilitoribacter nigricans (strain ATCC 23147 / DSM 23189 / NBRC 102662 / NCIMB 1420 / SS-2) TaxID=1122177 RepID=A0A2D0MZF9_FLAN2|nr:VOC family protein [Flavilitoribacter nigricans]PHN01661.1 ring-cleaving dioxygenase [Flavilitoribacter nigricans DSM 23189 = NBRC 102662]